MTPSNDGARALERLLTVCSDGVEGYRRATAAVRASEIRAVLQRNEVEREEIASVVTNALVELGAKGGHGGSLAGAAHRDFLAALGATHADAAIVHECLRGDQVTLGAFAEALSHDLPAEIGSRISAQQARVVHAVERLTGIFPVASPSAPA
jgi:uncharacterized protein (TIGR02284 family)